jgi:hypothetical protein
MWWDGGGGGVSPQAGEARRSWGFPPRATAMFYPATRPKPFEYSYK